MLDPQSLLVCIIIPAVMSAICCVNIKLKRSLIKLLQGTSHRKYIREGSEIEVTIKMKHHFFALLLNYPINPKVYLILSFLTGIKYIFRYADVNLRRGGEEVTSPESVGP